MSFAASIQSRYGKWRPWDTITPRVSMSERVLRGQHAVAQIAVIVGGETVTGIDVSASTPTGWEAPAYYRVFPYDVAAVSRPNGATGEWCDFCVPKVDTYYGETRRNPYDIAKTAIPFDANRISPAYEVFTPFPGYTNPIRSKNTATTRPTIGGAFTGTENTEYRVEIDAITPALTFRWSRDGGASWVASGVPCLPGYFVTLEAGLGITWPTQTYAVGDRWEFFASPIRNELILVEWYVPSTAAVGDYTAEITISANGKTSIVCEYHVRVVGASQIVPKTSTIPNYYHSKRENIGNGHYSGADLTDENLAKRYVEAGIKHRLSLGYLYPQPAYNPTTKTITNWAAIEAWLAPYLDGTWAWGGKLIRTEMRNPSTISAAIAGIVRTGGIVTVTVASATGFYVGAKVQISGTDAAFTGFFDVSDVAGTTIQYADGRADTAAFGAGGSIGIQYRTQLTATGSLLPAFSDYSQGQIDYYTDFLSKFESKGWVPTIQQNIAEEPSATGTSGVGVISTELADAIRTCIGRLKAISDQIRCMVQKYRQFAVDDVVDVWCLPNCVSIYGDDTLTKGDAYADLIAEGREIIRYLACDCKGCFINNSTAYNNFPSVDIDHPMPVLIGHWWMCFEDGMTGDYYYTAHDSWDFRTAAYGGVTRDPWDSCNSYMGEGEGMYFLPGRPDRIGGTTHIPIETLRLKALRTGYEDWESFKLLEAEGHGPAVRAAIRAAVGTGHYKYSSYPPTVEAMESARDTILGLLDEEVNPPPAATRERIIRLIRR